MPRYVDIESDAVSEVIWRRAFKSREDIQEFLDNIPTADVVEVIHAKWENNLCCSVCGYLYDTGEYKNAHDYCPRCGAKMDGLTNQNKSVII